MVGKFVGLPVLIAAWATTALAQQGPIPNVNDGNALQRECTTALQAAANDGTSTNPDPVERGSDMGQCLGLVTGVWHTHMLMVDEFGSRAAFCPAATMSAGDMTRVVADYLQTHPAELDDWDTVLIMRSFIARYPCS